MQNMDPSQEVLFHQVKVHQSDMGGWLRVFADAESRNAVALPIYLSFGVSQWFRARPQFRLRCVVPITNRGDTVELHAWYDQHLFPEISGLHAEPVRKEQM
jgi:hypothetical protein